MSALQHPAPLSGASYSAVELLPDDATVVMLDQRQLPHEEVYIACRTAQDVAAGIRDMVVRGAPAIGVAAAYGMALAARGAPADEAAFMETMSVARDALLSARPTAVNLAWAVARLFRAASGLATEGATQRAASLAQAARAIHREDSASCRTLGGIGAALLPDSGTILTHCNAGALATGGYGTALGVIRAAVASGKKLRVLATETRPYLQGARLTAWELAKDGIAVEVITDSMVGHFMAQGGIGAVVVGADRIARNGDVANKIGTYGIAVLAEAHRIPLYVAAPWSTVDMACPDGAHIPIEERAAVELTHVAGTRMVAEGAGVRNPSFDVTPARLVARIVTELGAARPAEDALVALARLAARVEPVA